MHKKILVLLSSADKIPLREGRYHSTGIFLGELVEPLAPLLAAGYEIHFTSLGGKAANIDANSYRLMYWSFSKKKLEDGIKTYNQLIALGLNDPIPLDSLLKDSNLLAPYDLLFVPGGHAPMTDLLHEDWLSSDIKNPRVGALLAYFKENDKLTALICHAPAILACATTEAGKPLYEGYEATCVTRLSEFMTEDLPPFKAVHGHLKKYPEDFLREAGILLKQSSLPMISNVVTDRNLITGQDPYSAKRLGKELHQRLSQL